MFEFGCQPIQLESLNQLIKDQKDLVLYSGSLVALIPMLQHPRRTLRRKEEVQDEMLQWSLAEERERRRIKTEKSVILV